MPGFKVNGQGDGPSSTVEVARSHRWKVEFSSVTEDVVLFAKSINRPTIEIDQIKMHYQQTEIYLPGKHRWGTITADFYDIMPTGKDQTALDFFFYWSESIIDLQKNVIAPLSGIQQQRMTVTTLDGDGEDSVIITLEGVWPVKIEPSELNYTSSELSTTKVTFRFDASQIEPGKG